MKTKFFVKSPSYNNLDDVSREFGRIQEAFSKLATHIPTEISTEKPEKDLSLQIVYADGVHWNPGQGEGLYVQINNSWKKIQLT